MKQIEIKGVQEPGIKDGWIWFVCASEKGQNLMEWLSPITFQWPSGAISLVWWNGSTSCLPPSSLYPA